MQSKAQFEKPEIICALPGPIPTIAQTTAVRSTWLRRSLDHLISTGREHQLFSKLPAPLHESIRTLVAGTWVPMDVAEGYYAAYNQLGMTPDELRLAGRGTGSTLAQIMGTVARGIGLDPWAMLRFANRAYERMYRGGALEVVKIGAREAHISIYRCTLFKIPCCEYLAAGALEGTIERFSKRAIVRELSRSPDPLRDITYRAIWS